MNVIRVENIGKEYRVGALDAMGGPGLLRDKLAGALRHPLGLVKRKPKETFWALKDISFEVKEGEVLGLIGRNGAGKSTLLKILSRITKPTTGHAEIHGRVGSLLEVGTGFHPELSGRENVFLNGAILGMRRQEITRKFDEIVAFAEVEKFIDTPVKHYSSGMYIRLAFAVAAHLETEILFVDEVLSVGDLSFQKKCLGKMDDVSQQGRTIIFISHQINQVRRLCHRVVWLDRGRIRQLGNTGVVVGDYEVDVLARAKAEVAESKCFMGWSIEGAGNSLHDGMGQVKFCLDLRLRQPVVRGHVGVNVFSETEVLLGGWGFDDVNIPAGLQTLTVAFPFLPLKPGRYWIRCALFNNGSNVTGGQVIETWESPEALIVDAVPRSHSQEEWSGFLNIPAALSVPGDGSECPCEVVYSSEGLR